MQQLEGFQYTTTLYLNMVYYTIDISPVSRYLTTTVTEFGTLRYNRVLMGICASGDIFRVKIDELIGDRGVRDVY